MYFRFYRECLFRNVLLSSMKYLSIFLMGKHLSMYLVEKFFFIDHQLFTFLNIVALFLND